MQITFQAKVHRDIPPKYKTKESRENTVAVLGSSKTVDEILDYMDICSNSTKAMVLSGKNLVHGCGTAGIMGAAYDSGYNCDSGRRDSIFSYQPRHFARWRYCA